MIAAANKPHIPIDLGIDHRTFKEVTSFKYLRNLIDCNAYSSIAIRDQIQPAGSRAYYVNQGQVKKVFFNRKI